MEYFVAQGETIDKLVSRVNNMIKAGFKPIGGVSISYSRSDGYTVEKYYQAMIK
jgi:hypothetical protein